MYLYIGWCGDLSRRKIIQTAVICAAVLVIVLIGYDTFFNKTAEREIFAMNTFVNARFSGKDSELALIQFEKMIRELDGNVLSRKNENSELYAINSGSTKVMSDKMAGYLSVVFDIADRSGGKFDPTLGAVSDLWGFGTLPHLPDAEKIKKALNETGFEKVAISGNSIEKGSSGMIIDLGSAGKGIALDETKALLREIRLKKAVVSVGGSILLYGDKSFTVGIRDPKGNSGAYIITLETGAACVSTSGSYEQCFSENGKTYHHILDPDTGYPVENGLVSVTVVSDSGIMSDILSTACFALGTEKGMKLAEDCGCEAIFVSADKKISASDGIRGSLKITDKSYSFAE